MADKQLSKEYTDNGWQLAHAQPALAANDSPTGAPRAGNYIALKRSDAGLIEFGAESVDQIEHMIADWERSRPADPSAQPQPTEEQIRNSAEATLHQSITAGARPAVDVDLTPAAKKAEPKAIRLAAKPAIEEIKLDEQTQAGIATGFTPAATSKVEGVGTGTDAGPAPKTSGGKKSSKSGSKK